MSATTTEHHQSPSQARSKATLERLYDAAEELLEDRDLELISIAELCAAAGVATGTFYTRFRSKDELLPRLYERYERDLATASDDVLDPARWDSLDLARTVRQIVDDMVRHYRSRRGLWRAMQLRVYSDPTSIGNDERARRAALIRTLVDVVLRRRAEITHPSPRRAVDFALAAVMATCKDKILFGDASRGMTRDVSDRVLARELSAMVLGLLRPEVG